ncbi:hypothetical protein [Roseateles sp. P5_E1]
MHLSLDFEDNESGHGDIALRFAGREWVCDSYYLALDDKLLPQAEDAAKVRAVLKRLHEQWLETAQSLCAGETAYLPYDFSDQYTGWLRCCRTQNGYLLTQGWSSVEGWSFSPSAVGPLLRELREFRADGPELEIGDSEFTTAIQTSASRTS